MNVAPPPGPPQKPKRYGWYRRYHDDDTKPFWRVVSMRAGTKLIETLAVKNNMADCASKARKAGFIGAFDIHECAIALEITPDTVSSIVRALVDLEWMTRDQKIVTWLDDQPPKEDDTAADRQRNKRARDAAKTRIATGLGTPDDFALVDAVEAELLLQIAKSAKLAPKDKKAAEAKKFAAFEPVAPSVNTAFANETARAETERAAMVWLFGDGTSITSYGEAVGILTLSYGCNRLTAEQMVRRWLQEMRDAVQLATIISSSYLQGLRDEAFRNVVAQRIEAFVREQTAGPEFKFGPTVQRGGRDVA